MELTSRNISWGKGGRCVGLTTLMCLSTRNYVSLNLLETPGPI